MSRNTPLYSISMRFNEKSGPTFTRKVSGASGGTDLLGSARYPPENEWRGHLVGHLSKNQLKTVIFDEISNFANYLVGARREWAEEKYVRDNTPMFLAVT